MLVYACDHHPIDLLLSKVRQNDNKFKIEELTKTPTFLFNDYISEVSNELNSGTVLVDCGCPGQAHDDLHKAVKYFTLKPFEPKKSKSWKVLRLIHKDGKIDSRSWSTLFDHVEVMYYGELNGEVVDDILNKLGEYVSSRRTSSIDLGKPDVQLLETIHQEEKRKQQELANTIITGFQATVGTVIEKVNKQKEETHDKLNVIGDNVILLKTQQSSMSECALFILTILMCVLLYIIVQDGRRQLEQCNEEN